MALHVIKVPDRPMDAVDRCDRCGAQAYVEVDLSSGGRLLFCGHHYTEHEDGLSKLSMAVTVADHRDHLQQQEAKFKGEAQPA